MKFRDPKTGKVFECIEQVIEEFRCPGACFRCPIGAKTGGVSSCLSGVWWKDHPIEAARMMGYEVIEDEQKRSCFNCWRYQDENFPCAVPNVDRMIGCSAWEKKEVNMEKKDKPRLAEVLGVEVGELFKVRDSDGGWDGDVVFYINEYGKFISGIAPGSSIALCCAIQHPESIIRTPRLTEPEIAIMRAVGAKWVSRNKVGRNSLHLWNEKPAENNGCYFNGDAVSLATVDEKLFPSVHPGDCICVEEAGGDA